MTSTIYNRLMIGASLAAIALPAHARDSAEDIIVTAQKQNQTAVLRGGSVGVFGDKAAEDTPFSIKTYNEALILNQQPQTLGQVLENDPSVRTTLGFGIAGELFVIRGRSEERRVGKGWVSTCRSRGAADHTKKKKKIR